MLQCHIYIHAYRPGLELYVDPFYATAGADSGHSAAAAASEEKESHYQPRHPSSSSSSSSSSGFNTRNIVQELSILSGKLLPRQLPALHTYIHTYIHVIIRCYYHELII